MTNLSNVKHISYHSFRLCANRLLKFQLFIQNLNPSIKQNECEDNVFISNEWCNWSSNTVHSKTQQISCLFVGINNSIVKTLTLRVYLFLLENNSKKNRWNGLICFMASLNLIELKKVISSISINRLQHTINSIKFVFLCFCFVFVSKEWR